MVELYLYILDMKSLHLVFIFFPTNLNYVEANGVASNHIQHASFFSVTRYLSLCIRPLIYFLGYMRGALEKFEGVFAVDLSGAEMFASAASNGTQLFTPIQFIEGSAGTWPLVVHLYCNQRVVLTD